jgi:hypothetical protein
MSLEEMGRNDNKLVYNMFLNASMVLGIVVFGIVGGRLSGSFGFDFGPVVALVFVMSLVVVVLGVQFGVVWLVGGLTLAPLLRDGILRAKRRYFAAGVLLISPAAFMLSGGSLDMWSRDFFVFCSIVFLAVVMYVMFAVHTLLLFVRQKVSVLVWFLYLCTVEIFPVSLIVLIGVKNS